MNNGEFRVELLDLSRAERHVFKTYKEQMLSDPASDSFDIDYDIVIGFGVSRPVARYITPSGQVYVVVGGKGLRGPIMLSNPLHVGVVKKYPEGKHPNPNRLVDDHYVTLFPSDLISADACEVPISQVIPNDQSYWQAAIVQALQGAS